jgi:hypothetical protein
MSNGAQVGQAKCQTVAAPAAAKNGMKLEVDGSGERRRVGLLTEGVS